MQKSCWIIRIFFSVCYLEYHFNSSQKISQRNTAHIFSPKALLILIHINTRIILHKPKIVNLFKWMGWGGGWRVTMHHFENIMQIGWSYQRFSATVKIILNQICTHPESHYATKLVTGYVKAQNASVALFKIKILHIC